MPRDSMGREFGDERRDRKVADHVDAIRILLGDQVLALVCQDDGGEIYVVSPEHIKFEVLHLMAQVDWGYALIREAAGDSAGQ